LLLKDFIPAEDVRSFVQLYRIVHLQFEPGQPIPFKAYPPRPEHCLAFYPYDTETVEYKNSGRQVHHVPVVLYGQFSEVTNRLIGHRFLVFQIIFYPGALYCLTGIPASVLSNEYLDAESVFSSSLRLINEQLYHAKDYKDMVGIANHFVRELIKKQKKSLLPVDDACRWLLQQNGLAMVDDIAHHAYLSTRQLERRFAERTGVAPKTYERIIRFDKAFRLKNSKPHFDWLRIALECDFHDYQHLCKAYKDFTGLSPNAFHEIENKAPERTFGLSEGFYT
jgi:AraC-like DNA-binding protein